ncbi:hypothetical protein PCANC_18176 [Puccinia coronata f. sp. avenae]|uniref:Uncharacterized protein n=1 Tax=Puccinia coronata f. sp. avenae TaxID=200324 RepID=A0A2N5SNR0_9BASI|nr:hypothetical protein PCANC_18176 [Puccinia coronata f. sp. avenae]
MFTCSLKLGFISHLLWLVAHVSAPPSIWENGAYEAADTPGTSSLSSNSPGLQHPSEKYSWDLNHEPDLIPNPAFFHVLLDPTLTLTLTLLGKRKPDLGSPFSPNPRPTHRTPSKPRDAPGSTASTSILSHVNQDDHILQSIAKKHQYHHRHDSSKISGSDSTPTPITDAPLFPMGFGASTFSEPNLMPTNQVHESHPWTIAQLNAPDELPLMPSSNSKDSQEFAKLSPSGIRSIDKPDWLAPNRNHEKYLRTETWIDALDHDLSFISSSHGGHSQELNKLSSSKILTSEPDLTALNQFHETHARTDALDKLPLISSTSGHDGNQGHYKPSTSE